MLSPGSAHEPGPQSISFLGRPLSPARTYPSLPTAQLLPGALADMPSAEISSPLHLLTPCPLCSVAPATPFLQTWMPNSLPQAKFSKPLCPPVPTLSRWPGPADHHGLLLAPCAHSFPHGPTSHSSGTRQPHTESPHMPAHMHMPPAEGCSPHSDPPVCVAHLRPGLGFFLA